MSTLNRKPCLLVLDSDGTLADRIRVLLGEGVEVVAYPGLSAVLEGVVGLSEVARPMVVVLQASGLGSEGGARLEALVQWTTRFPRARFFVAGSDLSSGWLLDAVEHGVEGVLDVPCVGHEGEWRVLLTQALRMAVMDVDLAERREREGALQTNVEGMMGRSAKMQKIFGLVRKVAPSDVQVLVLGESGTGKEVMAGAIHRLSPRREQPFVAINCAAIPEALLESELFGHEKGAFTGAHAQRVGRIEMAEGGTLFLDEIGELPMPLQVKLLRFLQERTFERIGGRVSLKANVRVVSATNADLTKAMRENRFREDLYYRLAVITAVLPPLRERMDDVVLLAKAFLKRVSEEEGKPKLSFSVPAIRALERHAWPGNVRELLNRVKRAVILAEGRSIRPADLDLGEGAGGGFQTLKEAREKVEREMALESLQRHGGNLTRVAEELGISRPALYELLDRFGMKP